MSFNTDFKPLFPQLKQRINDIFLHEQNASIHSSEKLLFFKSFCLSPERAYYVDHLENFINRSVVSKFRLSAHNLEIERGRHCNITREDRLCKMCNDATIEDEKHLFWQCSKYSNERKVFLNKLSYLWNINCDNLREENFFKSIMNTKNQNVLNLLSSFLQKLFEIRNSSVSGV